MRVLLFAAIAALSLGACQKDARMIPGHSEAPVYSSNLLYNYSKAFHSVEYYNVEDANDVLVNTLSLEEAHDLEPCEENSYTIRNGCDYTYRSSIKSFGDSLPYLKSSALPGDGFLYYSFYTNYGLTETQMPGQEDAEFLSHLTYFQFLPTMETYWINYENFRVDTSLYPPQYYTLEYKQVNDNPVIIFTRNNKPGSNIIQSFTLDKQRGLTNFTIGISDTNNEIVDTKTYQLKGF